MYQKITLTLPESLIEKFYKLVPKGKRSEFVAEKLEDGLLDKQIKDNFEKKREVFERIKQVADSLREKDLSIDEIIELKNIGRE